MKSRIFKLPREVNTFGKAHMKGLSILTLWGCLLVFSAREGLKAWSLAQALLTQEQIRQEALPEPEQGAVQLRGVAFNYKVVVIDGHEYLATKVGDGWALCLKGEDHGTR